MSSLLRDIFAELLAFETTSRESNLAMIGAIDAFLRQRGIQTQRFYSKDGRKANLYARIGPAGDGGVMLSGHTDTVPVDGQSWTVPPFQLTEQEGRYYGRGSADMKGFIACTLASIDDFMTTTLRMPLHLAFSYDEEVGCLGVRSLVDYLQASPEKPALCIVGEPTSMAPVYGHKGKLAMRCCIEGHACHSAYAPDGVNSISYAAKLITKLDGLGQEMAAYQDSRFTPSFSTVQVGTITGGIALNIVPEHCHFDFEIRYLPESDPSDITQALAAYANQQLLPEMRSVSPDSAIRFHQISHYPGLICDPQSDFCQWLAQWCGSDRFSTVAFGTEGGLFNALGIATMICGPGSMEQGHKADEFVEIAQLEHCMAMLDNLRNWMSVSQEG